MTKNRIISIAIFLLWFAAVFDPIGNVFFLRYIALAAAIAAILIFGLYSQILSRENSLRKTLTIYISFLMPIYGLSLCLIHGGVGAEFRDTSYLAAGVLFFLSLIYSDESLVKTGIQAMIFPLRILSLLIFIVYGAMISEFNQDWLSFFTERSVAFFGFRQYAGIELPYIYFLASPLLVYLIAYDLNKLFSDHKAKYVPLVCLSILAYAFSGTRSHQLLAIASIPTFYILLHSKHKILSLYFILLSIFIGLSIFNFEILESMFSTEEASNSLKIALVDGFLDIFDSPIAFIFGQGFNAHTWSMQYMDMLGVGDGNIASKTEWTYIELVRVYGIVGALPFFVLLGILIYRLARTSNKYRWLLPAFLIHLADSATNPYIFSTNGMLPLGLIVGILSLKNYKQRVKWQNSESSVK